MPGTFQRPSSAGARGANDLAAIGTAGLSKPEEKGGQGREKRKKKGRSQKSKERIENPISEKLYTIRKIEIQVHPKVEEAPLLQIVHENSGERVQSAPARQQRRNLDDARETQDHFPSQTQGHEFSCSDKEDDENRQDLIVGTESRRESDEVKSMGPVMQYLGDNQSHPVHLGGQLKHQAKPGKQARQAS